MSVVLADVEEPALEEAAAERRRDRGLERARRPSPTSPTPTPWTPSRDARRRALRRRPRRVQQRRRRHPRADLGADARRLAVGARRRPVGRDPRRADVRPDAARAGRAGPRRQHGLDRRPRAVADDRARTTSPRPASSPLSETLDMELRELGAPIGVSVLCPGVVPTRIADSGRNRPGGRRPAPLDIPTQDDAPADGHDARTDRRPGRRRHPRRRVLDRHPRGLAPTDRAAAVGHRSRRAPDRARRSSERERSTMTDTLLPADRGREGRLARHPLRLRRPPPLHGFHQELDELRERSPFYWSTYGPVGFWMVMRYDARARGVPALRGLLQRLDRPARPRPGVPVHPDAGEPAGPREVPPGAQRLVLTRRRRPHHAHGPARSASPTSNGSPSRARATSSRTSRCATRPRCSSASSGSRRGRRDVRAARRPVLRARSTARTRTPIAEIAGTIQGYFADVLADRRRQPARPRRGLRHATCPNATVFDRPLTEQEILDICFVLVLAGLDTTRGQSGYLWHHLATHDDDRRRIAADPALAQGRHRGDAAAVHDHHRRRPQDRPGLRLPRGAAGAGSDGVALGGGRQPRPAGVRGPDDVPTSTATATSTSASPAARTAAWAPTWPARRWRSPLEEWHRRIPDYRLGGEAPVERARRDADAVQPAAGVGRVGVSAIR